MLWRTGIAAQYVARPKAIGQKMASESADPIARSVGRVFHKEHRFKLMRYPAKWCLRLNAAIIERRGGGKQTRDPQMRTLTAYGIGVVIVLAALNGVAWKVGTPRLHDLNVFSAGFALGVLDTYISAWLKRYRRIA
jgi:hypothetical protein